MSRDFYLKSNCDKLSCDINSNFTKGLSDGFDRSIGGLNGYLDVVAESK